jgi:hypothetical protein
MRIELSSNAAQCRFDTPFERRLFVGIGARPTIVRGDSRRFALSTLIKYATNKTKLLNDCRDNCSIQIASFWRAPASLRIPIDAAANVIPLASAGDNSPLPPCILYNPVALAI